MEAGAVVDAHSVFFLVIWKGSCFDQNVMYQITMNCTRVMETSYLET